MQTNSAPIIRVHSCSFVAKLNCGTVSAARVSDCRGGVKLYAGGGATLSYAACGHDADQEPGRGSWAAAVRSHGAEDRTHRGWAHTSRVRAEDHGTVRRGGAEAGSDQGRNARVAGTGRV